MLQFFTTGIILVPFMLLGELFPVKARSIATGITTAICNVFVFIAIKSFYDLENWLNLPSTMCIYAVCGIIGYDVFAQQHSRNNFQRNSLFFSLFSLFVTFNILPETEGCTLEDIEVHFSDNQKKFTERNIVRIAMRNSDAENHG